MKYLDFDNEKYEKGFKPFDLTGKNIRSNVGKRICYVLSGDVDKHRGYFRVRYSIIHSKHYSQLILDEGNDSIDIRNVLECGIEI